MVEQNKLPALQIRVATIDDSDIVAQIGASTFTESFGHFYSSENLTRFLETNHAPTQARELITDPQFRTWLAIDQHEVIGYCVCGPCHLPVDPMPDNSGELKRLYVTQAGQGSGAGTAMLKLGLEWLHANFEHLFISVYAENFGAKRLYERHGFTEFSRYHFMVGDHADPELILKYTG